MKVLWLVLAICFATVCSKDIGLLLHFLLSFHIPDSTNTQQDEVSSPDVKFYLRTRRNDQPTELNQNNLVQVDPNNPVKVIVHGWLESSSRQWVQNMTDEYLKKSDYNIIQVDYSVVAARRYAIAASNVAEVGGLVGRLIVNLIANQRVPLTNFHIIGHSLGAHVSGFAGKTVFRLTGSKVPRITALDAAGPLFETPPILNFEGLAKEDAEVLDAIHTDAGVFGYKTSLGTVDFFPNGGGAVQPGCPGFALGSILTNTQQGLEDLFCSHTKSYFYFIDSINDGRFVGTKCGSWNKFLSGNCSDNFQALMGDGYVFSPEATGNLYLRTNGNPPFAQLLIRQRVTVG